MPRPTPSSGPVSTPTRPFRQFFVPREQPDERCELCAEPIAGDHAHLVNIVDRRLMCVCSACRFLFSAPGSGGNRFRSVPDRYVSLPASDSLNVAWNALAIPVDLAFVFVNSQRQRAVAFYPSPVGATESELLPEAWQALQGTSSDLATLVDDVEALLVRKNNDGSLSAFLVPIDVCYELVGRLRQTWKGFQGGDEAWREIAAFMHRIVVRAGEVAR